MISLIALTMWRYPPFLDFLSYVVELSVIDEVIIINNNVSETPNHAILNHPKIRVEYCDPNIYVCPGWNKGVELAKNEKICIINDDVIVDLKIFIAANRFMSVTENFGCLGIEPGTYNNQVKPYDGVLEIVPESKVLNTCGFAWVFFTLKSNYVVVPSEFKIFYSDTINWMSQRFANRTNYLVRNCFFYTPDGRGATTNKTLKENMPIYMVDYGVNNEDLAYKKWLEEKTKERK